MPAKPPGRHRRLPHIILLAQRPRVRIVRSPGHQLCPPSKPGNRAIQARTQAETQGHENANRLGSHLRRHSSIIAVALLPWTPAPLTPGQPAVQVRPGARALQSHVAEEEYGGRSAGTMLRNRTPMSVLQKTYDESYLTCSTAVYYERQVRISPTFVALLGLCSCTIPENSHTFDHRATKRRRCGAGSRLENRYMTITRTGCCPTTCPVRKPRGHWSTACGSWSCSAKNALTYWKPSGYHGRKTQRCNTPARLARTRFERLQTTRALRRRKRAGLAKGRFQQSHTQNWRDPPYHNDRLCLRGRRQDKPSWEAVGALVWT